MDNHYKQYLINAVYVMLLACIQSCAAVEPQQGDVDKAHIYLTNLDEAGLALTKKTGVTVNGLYLRASSVAYEHFANEFSLANLDKYLFVVEEQGDVYQVVVSAPRKRNVETVIDDEAIQESNTYASVIYQIDKDSFEIINTNRIKRYQ